MARPAAAKRSADRRQNVRNHAQYAGSIESARARKDLCVIWDISGTGARLVVPEAKKVPDRFTLVINVRGKRQRRLCDVIWRTECQVGVSFHDE